MRVCVCVCVLPETVIAYQGVPTCPGRHRWYHSCRQVTTIYSVLSSRTWKAKQDTSNKAFMTFEKSIHRFPFLTLFLH